MSESTQVLLHGKAALVLGAQGRVRALGLRMRASTAACSAVLSVALAACTDGATRIAYDIEAGAAAFRHINAAHYSIKHVPEASPDGCAGPYRVQVSERSILVIWCMDATASRVLASHGTTYHLNFVDVPRTFKLDKGAGEPLLIELEKRDGRIIVADVK